MAGDTPSKAGDSKAGDEVCDALEALAEALQQNKETADQVLATIAAVLEQRRAGRAWSEIVPAEERPLVVEQLTENFERLATAGSRLRREQARALHDEGMTMEQIAGLYGVTRQRISALLRAGR